MKPYFTYWRSSITRQFGFEIGKTTGYTTHWFLHITLWHITYDVGFFHD